MLNKMKLWMIALMIVTLGAGLGDYALGYAEDNFPPRSETSNPHTGAKEWAIELIRKNPDNGVEEMFNVQDGKYYPIVDRTKEVHRQALKAGSAGRPKKLRGNIEEPPIPDCNDGSHASQGIWYYTTDIKNNLNNPSSPYYYKNGQPFGIDAFMMIHTNGLYNYSGTDSEWLYVTTSGVMDKSIEVIVAYTYGNCFTSMDRVVYAYDGTHNGFNQVGTLFNMNTYKTTLSDGFGTNQKYFHIVNTIKYLPSTGTWLNEAFFFNYNSTPQTWDRLYSWGKSIPDSDWSNMGNSKWAGILEYYPSSNNPLPIKEIGYRDIYRIFGGNYARLNGTNAFKQDSLPSGRTPDNRRYVGWITNYIWTAGSTLDFN